MLQGKTLTEAARRAGYSEKNLAQSGHQVLKAIRLGMPELMDEVGLTERALIEKHLVPLLSAKVPKFFQHKGKVIDSRQVPAHATRLNALDIALRLRGAYERPQVQQEQKTVSVIMLDSSLRPDRTGLVDTRDTLEVTPPALNGTKPNGTAL